MRRTYILVLTVAFVAARVYADCVGSSLDAESVKAIAHAQTVQELDAAFTKHGRRNAALKALYRRQRLHLNPTRSEELRFLRDLPRSESELNQVYELVDTTGLCDDPATQRTVYGMFDAAGYLVYRHGVFHRRFIELTAWSNAEVGEIASPIYGWLLENDPELTVQGLRASGEGMRRRFCRGVDPRHLSVRRAMNVCTTELGADPPLYEP